MAIFSFTATTTTTTGLEEYISSMTSAFRPKLGTKCDYHPSRPARQGFYGAEEDFGREETHLCRECVNRRLRALAEFFFNTPAPGMECCERCKVTFPDFSVLIEEGVKTISNNFRNYRDPEDHLVRRLCDTCVRKSQAYWAAEAEADYDAEVEWGGDDYLEQEDCQEEEQPVFGKEEEGIWARVDRYRKQLPVR